MKDLLFLREVTAEILGFKGEDLCRHPLFEISTLLKPSYEDHLPEQFYILRPCFFRENTRTAPGESPLAMSRKAFVSQPLEKSTLSLKALPQ